MSLTKVQSDVWSRVRVPKRGGTGKEEGWFNLRLTSIMVRQLKTIGLERRCEEDVFSYPSTKGLTTEDKRCEEEELKYLDLARVWSHVWLE